MKEKQTKKKKNQDVDAKDFFFFEGKTKKEKIFLQKWYFRGTVAE